MSEHVHIGMPVFNGEPHLREALESLLNQSYENFQLFIIDNLSTDETPEIVKRYVKKDSRISYFRQNIWLSATANWNRTYDIAAGDAKFFMWASDDDLWHREFIESALAPMIENQKIVLSFSECDEIDIRGEKINEIYRKSYPRGKTAFGRIRSLLKLRKFAAIYGLIRTAGIDWDPCFQNTSFPVDLWFLIRLATSGKFHIVKKPLFLKRAGGLGETGNDPSVSHDQLKTWNIGKREWNDICGLNLGYFEKVYTFYRLRFLAKCRYPQYKKIDWFLYPYFVISMLLQDPHYFGLRSKFRRYCSKFLA